MDIIKFIQDPSRVSRYLLQLFWRPLIYYPSASSSFTQDFRYWLRYCNLNYQFCVIDLL